MIDSSEYSFFSVKQSDWYYDIISHVLVFSTETRDIPFTHSVAVMTSLILILKLHCNDGPVDRDHDIRMQNCELVG